VTKENEKLKEEIKLIESKMKKEKDIVELKKTELQKQKKELEKKIENNEKLEAIEALIEVSKSGGLKCQIL